jgi:hypothetical protein
MCGSRVRDGECSAGDLRLFNFVTTPGAGAQPAMPVVAPLPTRSQSLGRHPRPCLPVELTRQTPLTTTLGEGGRHQPD